MNILAYNFVVIAVISIVGYFIRQGLTNMFIMQDKLRPFRTLKSTYIYIFLMGLLSVFQLFLIFYILNIEISKHSSQVAIVDTLTITFSILTLILGLGVDGVVNKDRIDVSQ